MSTVSAQRSDQNQAGGRRVMTFMLAEVERQTLIRMARGIPARIRPNHLTALGVLGAVGAGVAYAATSVHPAWLLLASLALAVNWLGDSLDGTLARVRRIERPRYGYYLDHVVDAFNTAAVGVGLALSPFVQPEVALGVVILYLALSINVYIETAVYGEFRMAYGRIGPTEARILMVIANTVVFVASSGLGVAAIAPVTNGMMIVAAGAASLLLVVRFVTNLRHLAQLEPQRGAPAEPPLVS